MKNSLIILILTLFVSNCFCQEVVVNPEVKKYFLIAASTTDYKEGLLIANSISSQLDLKLDLRGLIKGDDNLGVSFAEQDCKENNWDYPCYVARGRSVDGDFVSIEWSSAYNRFSKGYYMVMISSCTNYSNELKDLLKKTKEYISTAYVKSSMVYLHWSKENTLINRIH